MTPEEWQAWLHISSPTFPQTARAALPAELWPNCLILDNDPLAANSEARGSLSLDRLTSLTEALVGVDQTWLVGYWDGLSGVEPALQRYFSRDLFILDFPNRAYLCLETHLDQIVGFSRSWRLGIGPSLLASSSRGALMISDLDWRVSVVGLDSVVTKSAVMSTLNALKLEFEADCDPDRPLYSY